jgi:uncharacterized membrane protein YfcA
MIGDAKANHLNSRTHPICDIPPHVRYGSRFMARLHGALPMDLGGVEVGLERFLDFVRRKRWQVAGLVVLAVGAAIAILGQDNFLLRTLGIIIVMVALWVSRQGRPRTQPSPAVQSQKRAAVWVGVGGALLVTILLFVLVFSGVPEAYVNIVSFGALILVFVAIYGVVRVMRRKGPS